MMIALMARYLALLFTLMLVVIALMVRWVIRAMKSLFRNAEGELKRDNRNLNAA